MKLQNKISCWPYLEMKIASNKLTDLSDMVKKFNK